MGRTTLRVGLDAGGTHHLLVSRDSVELRHDGGERLSRLHRALGHHLRIAPEASSAPDAPALKLDELGRAALPPGTRRIGVRLGDTPSSLASITIDPEIAEEGTSTTLSPFEARYLADNGHPHPAGLGAALSDAVVRTDLHTHLAGAPYAEDLIRIGVEHDVGYPRALLDECGIHAAPVPTDRVALSSLSPEAIARLVRVLRLPLDRQSTFLDMERVYRLRSPITKHPAAFVPMLWQIARDLRASGVRYAELSAGEIIRADRLRAATAAVREIEAATGVRLRFLVALSRHDDWEWDEDVFDRLDDLASSRVLVGVDFMGHETTSTLAFARQLDRVSTWAASRRPGFVVRVHAGENPAHPENVRVAIEHVARPGVCLRIGHGVYGVDDATMDLLRKHAVIVEVNPSSSFALNNIQSSRELPLLRYLRAGIDCVIGSDGHGTYQTSAPLEVRAAWLSGASSADLEHIRASEERYLALREAWDAKLPESAPIPDDRPPLHFSPAVAERAAATRLARESTLSAELAKLGVTRVARDGVDAWIGTRRCISIAGAWAHAWPSMPAADQAKIRSALDELIAGLDPSRVVLVSGGTRFGVENEVHLRAKTAGVEVLGVLSAESPIDAIEPSLARVAVIGEALHDKAAGLYELMKEANGLCLFFGGGNVVSDEIQTAQNLRLRFLLFEGVAGASGDKARQHPRNAFATAAQALARLDDDAFFRAPFEPFWHLGANPTVDAAIFRRGPGGLELLLIRREPDAAAEPDRWALIGGFVHTEAPKGSPWTPGAETARDALVREVREESGLELEGVADRLAHVGDFEGGGRDERDTPTAWSKTSLFTMVLDEARAALPIAGGDDACDARWWPVDALPAPLAFDHAVLIRRALVELASREVGR